MTRILLIFIAFLSLLGCQQDAGDPLVTEADVVLVEVNGEPVTLPMLEYLMEARGIAEDDTEGMRQMLDELIRLRAVANAARREGISGRERVRAERMIKDIEVQYVRYLEQLQRDNPITDAEIQAAYREQLDRSGDTRYQLETIEFAAQPEAMAELQALQAGEFDFDAAIDRATEAGRIARRTDWVDASQVPPEFMPVLEETEPGEVAGELLPYGQQWLVVRVLDRDALEAPPLEDVRDGIRRTLTRERAQAAIDLLFEQAEITPMLPLDEAAGGDGGDSES